MLNFYAFQLLIVDMCVDTWLVGCREYEKTETVIPVSEIKCLVIQIRTVAPIVTCSWHTIVMGTIVKAVSSDQDSGICIWQMDEFIDSYTRNVFPSSIRALATVGEVGLCSCVALWVEVNANNLKETVYFNAERCAGYACLIRQISLAWFYGHGKIIDASVSRRIALSLPICAIERFKTLLVSITDDVYRLFFQDAVQNSRQDFAVLALAILVYTFDQLKITQPDAWVPSMIVRSRTTSLNIVKLTNYVGQRNINADRSSKIPR